MVTAEEEDGGEQDRQGHCPHGAYILGEISST